MDNKLKVSLVNMITNKFRNGKDYRYVPMICKVKEFEDRITHFGDIENKVNR